MATFSVPCPKSTSSALSLRGLGSNQNNRLQQQRGQFMISYDSCPNWRPRSTTFATFGVQHNQRWSVVWKIHAKPKEFVVENSSKSLSLLEKAASQPVGKEESMEKKPVQHGTPETTSISEFMTQVADLIKLVDSRDIMELQLKQQDCELSIRKKEALLPPPPPPAPHVMAQSPTPYSTHPSQAPPVQPMAPAPAIPSTPSLALPSPTKASKSSHPPLKCPMAGTFYRSPAPGEPPFVKVGDKVQKGQVICIVEAMKLMNEIEADQSGTVVEVIAEDGKPVSVDTPLFVIAP